MSKRTSDLNFRMVDNTAVNKLNMSTFLIVIKKCSQIHFGFTLHCLLENSKHTTFQNVNYSALSPHLNNRAKS